MEPAQITMKIAQSILLGAGAIVCITGVAFFITTIVEIWND